MEQSRWAPKPGEDDYAATTPTASSLSAVATPFSPAPPPPDFSSNDYFAQTATTQDDLFDGVTPVDDSMRVRSEDDLFSDDFTPVQQPIVEQVKPDPPRGRGDTQRGRGRGRGRGPRETARGGATPTQPRAAPPTAEKPPVPAPMSDAVTPASPPENAPTGPRQVPLASVRGDRQATGGLRKPKLTEDELAEKMARIQLKNASLTAAHARAEADAAQYAEREEEAKRVSSQRQKEERRDRQQMIGERERNRMRKLKAMEGREWDAEKNEDDFGKGGRFDKSGGFAGDQQEYTDGREYLYREPRGGQRGRRGPERGSKPAQQPAPRQDEFPALPAGKPPDRAIGSPIDDGIDSAVKSWAEQVESANMT